MDAVNTVARKHGLKVIEDAAEVHGALFKGRKCGTLSDVSCFSFYANKIITTGEGGMVLTDDDALALRLSKLRDLCHSDRTRFIHEDLGYNYRMTNIQAAVGLGELRNIDRYIRRKIAIAARYTRTLEKIPGIRPPVTLAGARNVFWMYAVLIDEDQFGLSKDGFRKALAERGIDTRDFFYAPHLQPAITRKYPDTPVFRNTEFVSNHGCYLPSGLALTDKEIDRVLAAIREIHESHARA